MIKYSRYATENQQSLVSGYPRLVVIMLKLCMTWEFSSAKCFVGHLAVYFFFLFWFLVFGLFVFFGGGVFAFVCFGFFGGWGLQHVTIILFTTHFWLSSDNTGNDYTLCHFSNKWNTLSLCEGKITSSHQKTMCSHPSKSSHLYRLWRKSYIGTVNKVFVFSYGLLVLK